MSARGELPDACLGPGGDVIQKGVLGLLLTDSISEMRRRDKGLMQCLSVTSLCYACIKSLDEGLA